MNKPLEVNVWYWRLDEGQDADYGHVHWDDIPSNKRKTLKIGDRLLIKNQNDQKYMVQVVELEPCKVNGIYVEGV